MGTWGPKLYEDDLALDIKEEYTEKIREGKEEVALEEIIEEYQESIEDIDEKSIFWISLADTMWNLGRLNEDVKEKAIKEIENNLKKWKDEATEKEYKVREKELEHLKEKLDSKMKAKKEIHKEKGTQGKKKKYEWNIGDVYAYKLESEKAKELGLNNRYLIFRKVDEGISEGKRIKAIVYIQITKTDKLPQSEEEINELDYIITSNEGNVKHEYRAEIYPITQKCIKEKLIYLGNFSKIKTPSDEYIETIKINTIYWLWEQIDNEFLERAIKLGTDKKPERFEIDPIYISDSYIRFLMRQEYYEKALNMKVEQGVMVKDSPLLYIALVDSMMIRGFVRNPVGPLTQEMKEEAYKRIDELKKAILNREDKEKEKRIQILEELREKIQKYNYEDPFSRFLNNK